MNESERNELLGRLDERTESMKEDINSILKSINGNGVPGLVQRVDSLEASRDQARGFHKIIGVVGGGGGLISLASALYRYLHR